MAKGDIVAVLSDGAQNGTSYALTYNPDKFFAIFGNNLIEAKNTPAGRYTISIEHSVNNLILGQRQVTLDYFPTSAPTQIIFAEITLDNVAIGKAFAEIISSLTGSLSYSFISNPGNLFSLSGNKIKIDGLLSTTTYSIGILVSNGSQSETNILTINCISVADSWVPGIRPFSPTSPCNTPLAAGKTYTPVAWPASTGFNYYTGVKFYIDTPAADITTVVRWLAPSSWGNPTQILYRVMTPVFAGVTQVSGVSDGGDNEAVSMSGAQSLNIYNFNRPTDIAASSGAYAFDNVITGTGFGNQSTGSGAGIVAAGCNLLMGCLIKEEFTRYGEFNHWIAFSMIGSLMKPGWVAPAINGDGIHSDGLFQTGQLLAIPKNVAMPNGLSIYGQAMFRAMRDYGAFPMDTSGSVTPYMACVFDPTQGSADIPYAAPTSWALSDKGLLIADCNILFPLLQIVS